MSKLIQISGELSPVGWIAPMDLTSDSWKEVGKGIDKTNRMIGWVIADWLNAYPSEWGNIYDEATELTGLSYERLKKLKSLGNSVQLGRRQPNLSFYHHEMVAKFRDEPEKQKEWLDRAGQSKWSARELYEEIKSDEIEKRKDIENKHEEKVEQHDFQVEDEDLEIFEEKEEKHTLDWADSELIRKEEVLNGKTVVANKKTDKALIQWAQENNLYVPIDRTSVWGNPFIFPDDGTRNEVIKNYEWYYEKKPSLQSEINKLDGKVLGCWCYPEKCHGDIILNILNNTIIKEENDH
jgi:hypothetical protein